MGAAHGANAISVPELVDKALSLFVTAADEVPAGDWDRPSNLPDWTLRELVAHVTGTTEKAIALVSGAQVTSGPADPAGWIREDPAKQMHRMADRLREVLRDANLAAARQTPQGEVPLGQALTLPIADLTLHSWDLRHSLHRDASLPDAMLAFCRELLTSVPEEALRRPGVFGPATVPPPDASPTEELMAHLGRVVSR